MEYILQTDNLSKVYGTKTVLNHVSIHVPKKSIYGLVGKNGAGKTTLMRIICGLTQQSEGSYTLLGKTNDAAVRNRMGMLIEKPGIYEHMTALENLRYFSLLFGIQSQDHHKILEMYWCGMCSRSWVASSKMHLQWVHRYPSFLYI